VIIHRKGAKDAKNKKNLKNKGQGEKIFSSGLAVNFYLTFNHLKNFIITNIPLRSLRLRGEYLFDSPQRR